MTLSPMVLAPQPAVLDRQPLVVAPWHRGRVRRRQPVLLAPAQQRVAAVGLREKDGPPVRAGLEDRHEDLHDVRGLLPRAAVGPALVERVHELIREVKVLPPCTAPWRRAVRSVIRRMQNGGTGRSEKGSSTLDGNPQIDSFWFARIATEPKHKRTIFS